MKNATKALVVLTVFYWGSIVALKFNWGTFSDYTLFQNNVEVGIVGILLFLYLILYKLEEIDE